jgi:hypothetical protein
MPRPCLLKLLASLLSLFVLHACNDTSSSTAPATTTVTSAKALLAKSALSIAPKVASYRAALASNQQAILPLNLTGDAQLAQTIALSHAPIIAQLTDNNQKLRAEVMAVYPLRESDYTDEAAECKSNRCYRLEVYDFARNSLLLGLANVSTGKMISWRADQGRKPEIPERLKDLAIDIAIHAPELTEALGGVAPKWSDAQMASTKTALNGTRCERSKHLCVAPTFVQGNVAIWAIVDLTDMKLVGVQWTDVGTRTERVLAPAPTEQSLADAAIMQKYCERNTALSRAGWELNYMLTASDGLRIGEVRFKGKEFLTSAKLVDWHVSYSAHEGFGYADAIGCPNFSSAAVLPFSAPDISDIVENGSVTGFKLEQEFRSMGWPGACNYSYRQAYEFYADGRFRPSAGSIGAGCGNDGTYRPLLRIEPAGRDWQFSALIDGQFKPIAQERYFLNDDKLSADGSRFQLKNTDFSFNIVPARGQFPFSRSDNELVYVTASGKLESLADQATRQTSLADQAARQMNQQSRDEGASDLPTLGSCCNTNFEQGPEQFINATPEALNEGLVLWYVPQLKNDTSEGREYCWARNQIKDGVIRAEAFPCIGGPMFVPIARDLGNSGG